jgi:hypothetical protein
MSDPAKATEQTWATPSRLLIVLVLGSAALVATLVLSGGNGSSERGSSGPDGSPKETIPDVLRRFADLKNAGDAAANALLAPLPPPSQGSVPADEANRIQTAVFLRDNLRIDAVRPEHDKKGPPRFRLVTHGNVSAPTLRIQTDKGIDSVQRTMSHPDLIVEIDGEGKIHGVRAELNGG